MDTIFTYGSLQSEAIQMKIFGRILKGEREVLLGYSLFSILLEDENQAVISYPIISKSDKKEALIEGIVFEITATELEMADAYETENYTRIFLSFESGKKGWVYVAPENFTKNY